MKVLNPQYMGEITPKNEGNVGSHGMYILFDFACVGGLRVMKPSSIEDICLWVIPRSGYVQVSHFMSWRV